MGLVQQRRVRKVSTARRRPCSDDRRHRTRRGLTQSTHSGGSIPPSVGNGDADDVAEPSTLAYWGGTICTGTVSKRRSSVELLACNCQLWPVACNKVP